MAIAQIRDDNAQTITGGAPLRPDFAHAAEAATGAAITELNISAMNIAGNQNAQQQAVIMVVCATNPCYFSLGAAASAPADNTTMMVIPPNFPVFLKLSPTDKSAYHKQITAAGTLKVVAVV